MKAITLGLFHIQNGTGRKATMLQWKGGDAFEVSIESDVGRAVTHSRCMNGYSNALKSFAYCTSVDSEKLDDEGNDGGYDIVPPKKFGTNWSKQP